MKTPIIDFVNNYNNSKNLRLHMPGHKGVNILGFEERDITEIDGADVLYKADGIIKQSEDNARLLFETKKTFYSAEGSSLAIRAMLYLVKLYSSSVNKKPLIFAGRNAHKTFITAAAILDFDVRWLMPEISESIISCNITADYLDNILKNADEKPVAVYITSPDYLGNMLDIKALAKICKKHGVLLLTDNAHGAYLKFLPEDKHPIHLGADICCDSAHKTLPVLTGGAYLHISESAPQIFWEQAENALSIFASSSPSYLILQSLDYANKYISCGYREKLASFIEKLEILKAGLSDIGFCIFSDEPLKLTISPKSYGYTGYELSEILLKKGIVCEFCDSDFIVFMFTPETPLSGLEILQKALTEIIKKPAINTPALIIPKCKKVLSLKEAVFSPSKELAVEKCIGKILTAASVNCPPAVSIVVCGEEINSQAIECFKYYGIKTCFVADND